MCSRPLGSSPPARARSSTHRSTPPRSAGAFRETHSTSDKGRSMSVTDSPALTTVTPPEPTKDVPNPFQCGPDTPMGRYLRSFWQPVRVAEDLPPGRAEPLDILGESFTLYRGEDGVAHVTAPGCPHRLT